MVPKVPKIVFSNQKMELIESYFINLKCKKGLIVFGQNVKIQITVSHGRCLQLAWCRIQAAACRPVGKRGVQSGIFEDEQELLPPGRRPAVCR